MAEQFANNAASTLNGAINDSTTTIVVATGEGSRFPSVGNFRLLIGLDPFTAEIVLATARTSDTITVVRGQEGSTAQAWGNGTSVTHIMTAGAIEQIRTQFTTVVDEIYTTNTVSVDPLGTVASDHGDGSAQLYVNGKILGTSFSAGEIPLTTQNFNYVSDALQSFVVPDGVTLIKVKMWGPGGGTGSYSGAGGGGPGGFTTGLLSVTPGETLYLTVGSGGKKPTANSPGPGGLGGWPGGGFGTAGDASGGGGGGFTGIFNTSMTQANALMIAGGGGGATGFGSFGAGGGGGLIGGSGSGSSGKGGSQVIGGADGNNQGAPSTTIAAGSNGAILPQGTINVASTTGFPTVGIIYVTTSAGIQTVTYTGVTGTSFTGCSGGTGTMSTGGGVGGGVATIAAGSNGAILPQGTINVGSTTGFPTAGILLVFTSSGYQIVRYTGTTGTTFTGCTGGTGTMSTGGTVTLASAGSIFTGGIAFSDRTSFQPTGDDCGGGGSGYWGGGSGKSDGRHGGAGSGFISATRVTSGVTTTGANAGSGNTVTLPPSTTDVNYVAGIGVGAAASGASGTDGGNGYIVLQWGGITTLDLDSIDFGNTSSISTLDTNLTISPATNGTVTLSAAGTGGVTLAPGGGTITLQSASDLILSSATNLKLNVNAAQKLKMYTTGAIIVGPDQANNDTSTEAQAGLTGPLLNLSSSTGTFSTDTNQAIIFNQSGALNLQGNTEVRFNTGSTFRGYFDSSGIFRVGPSASSAATLQGTSAPFANSDYFYMYNSSGSAWAEIIAGTTNTRAALQVMNVGAGGTATVGVSLFSAGTAHATAEYAGNGIIEQVGAATSGLIFTKVQGNATNFASTGAIWQSGAWTIGRSTQNDTSTEAQAGLVGPLLNITQITSGSQTSATNQALLYNSAGTVTLQGHVGHSLVANTTTVASTITSKFITNVGRRVNTVVTTTNLGVSAGTEVIIVGAISSSVTITLPSGPTAGDTYTVKDQLGNAATNNIIVSGNGNNIDGETSYTMNANYQSITVVFANGTWSII